MTLNIVPLASVGAAVAEPAYSTSAASASSTISLGVVDTSRRIVAFIGNAADGGTISAVTINDISATQLATSANGLNRGYCFIVQLPTGDTGALVITGTSASYRLGIYALYEVGSNTPHDTEAGAVTTQNVDVPDRGVIIGSRFHISGANTSWTGLDEDFDNIAGGGQAISTAHREFSTSVSGHTISASGGASPAAVMIAVSFGA